MPRLRSPKGIPKTRTKGRLQRYRGLFWYPRLGWETSLFPLLTCGKSDVTQPNRGYQTRPDNVGAPFERMALDILGPFPVTTKDNWYVLVLIDYFTKWPEAIPIPDQEASTVAEELVRTWISRYGVPMMLHSNQGTNFNSILFSELCKF
ncbi:hypothetical protein AVEN_145414-1 [Araneus ventricosus]|uniref:Integrase catalytic domain-containing protein n=1 Tax=Araneus ventricosus TaxID=182803 RepID=A0A4Y2H8H8_ARAVE|nr:hypothetical protein AVEN_145414-1 [Araneus ventricosus]